MSAEKSRKEPTTNSVEVQLQNCTLENSKLVDDYKEGLPVPLAK